MLNFETGDVLKAVESGVVLAHVCNNKGGWGKGFTGVLSRWDSGPEKLYRLRTTVKGLGLVSFAPVAEGAFVANMVAQDGYKTAYNPVPLNYEALKECLKTVNEFCEQSGLRIVAPVFGCSLGGGNRDKVEQIIREFVKVPITVYDFIE